MVLAEPDVGIYGLLGGLFVCGVAHYCVVYELIINSILLSLMANPLSQQMRHRRKFLLLLLLLRIQSHLLQILRRRTKNVPIESRPRIFLHLSPSTTIPDPLISSCRISTIWFIARI